MGTKQKKKTSKKGEKVEGKPRRLSIEEYEPIKVERWFENSTIIIVLFAVLVAIFLTSEQAIIALVRREVASFSGFGSTEDIGKIKSSSLTTTQIKERAAKLPCEDKEDGSRCANIASTGGCERSPGWMNVMCAASCNTCELLDYDVRCDAKRLGLSKTPAYEKGEMDEMFEGLPGRFPQYNISYLSRPPDGPYIVQIDNFLSDIEINAMLDNVGMLKRSTDQGKIDPKTGVQEQKVSNSRTSENAWCMGACEKVPEVIAVKNRISDLVKIPEENFESFQMLRYQVGQEYQRHHDMSPRNADSLAGPRILTFFLYLSEVEEGGGTRFTDMQPPITMIPKKGSAILWPSVTSDNLYMQDRRTFHQAMPVIKGSKYGANSWIHLFEYKTPNLHGCTGAFS